MDDIIANIQTYLLELDETLEDDSLLDFILNDVVDRVLIYTNRKQLVEKYELDIADSSVEATDYVYPIPPELERSIALAVYRALKDLKVELAAENLEKEVKSISDNGQSITFSDKVATFMTSTTDHELFSGITSLLDKFIIPTIVENTNYINYKDKRTFLR